MPKQSLLLLVGACLLLAMGTLWLPDLLGSGDEAPLRRWEAAEEVELEAPAAPAEGADTESAEGAVQRTAVEADAGASLADEPRIDALLRGRVLNKFQAPVAGAYVWLDFGRGGRGGGPGPQAGRQRRVPDPVQTDREGRFAFQGQAFRQLRVTLQVAHGDYAPALFEKDLGNITAEVELGDLVVENGGEVIGRVTDLSGNGVPAAALRLEPENGNRLRQLRSRDQLLPAAATDQNGYFRLRHTAAGDWTLAVTAKRHTEGRSPLFAVEEDQPTELEDIRLGPGYELSGLVKDSRGAPVAKAEVTLRSTAMPRGRGPGGGRGGPGGQGGPGGFAGFGTRDHRTTTDESGRFFLEHLPGAPLQLEVQAEGYLDHQQGGVDATLGQVLVVTLQDGLRITGTALDAVDGTPVTQFAARAIRVRGLPVPGQPPVDLQALGEQLRQGNLDEATQQRLRSEFASAREAFGRGGRDGGGRGGPDAGGGGWRGGALRDLGKVTAHPDGTFVLTGLQEGVYEVHLQSPDHARYRSAEVELRLGSGAPDVRAQLDRGVFVAGLVRGANGQPIAGARVELRLPASDGGGGGGRRRGRGGDGAAPTPGGNGLDLEAMRREAMRQMSAATLPEATTDREGVFVLRHVPRGSYRLQAEARGFASTTTETFDLQADRSGVEVELGPLGAIAGRVLGLRSGEAASARVGVVPIGGQGGGMGGMFGRGRGQGGGGGPFQNVPVQADGTYRIEDLTPGNYLVRSWIGSPQELMRELGPQFFAGTLTADATVRGGETSNFDTTLTRPQVGKVAGTVLHNGAPAAGFQVELVRQEEAGNAAPNPGNGGRGGRGMFGGFGRTFRSAVASSGRYQIDDVPAGNYTLRVTPARRGGPLAEATIAVAADATTEHNLSVATQTLQGTVTAEPGVEAATLAGRASLLPGLAALPENLGQWQRENPGPETRVQNGTFRFDAVPAGNYLLVVTVRGRERSVLPVVIGAGSAQAVTVAAGKPAAEPANAAAPGGPRPGTPR